MTSKPTSSLRRRKGSDSTDNEHRRDRGGGDEKENKEKDKDKRDQNKLKEEDDDDEVKRRTKRRYKNWSCVDSCCWFVGCICSIWWLLLFLFNAMPASIPQYVTEAITGPLPDPPGVKLRKEGLVAKHPVVFVPGIVTGGLELWEGHQCAEGLFRKRLWGGSFGEVYKRFIILAGYLLCALLFVFSKVKSRFR